MIMADSMKIRDIKKRSSAMFRKCWAESAFISLLQMGIQLLLYALLILAGIFTGAHEGKSILPVFTSFSPAFIASAVILILSTYILTAPLWVGIKWYFWHASEGNVMPVSSVFAGYRTTECALRFIKLKLITDMRRLTPLTAAVIFIAVDISLTKKMLLLYGESGASGILIKTGCTAVCLGIIIMYLISGMRYVPVGYLLADNPDSSADSIIVLSRKLVAKKYAGMFMLYVSFAGWYISCLMGFPLLVLIPYMHMTTAVFVHSCMERQDLTEEETAETEKESLTVG